MPQLMYTMQFKGKAVSADEAGTVLKANTTAASCTLTTTVGPDEVRGTFQPTDGGQATFESEVSFTGETTFQESGTITFGENRHRLHFSTVGQGYIGPSADPSLKHGSVIWKIDRGEGQFERARGLITSNFFVSDEREVTENHFGVIFMR